MSVYKRSYTSDFNKERDVDALAALRSKILDSLFYLGLYLPNDVQLQASAEAARRDAQNTLMLFIKDAVHRQRLPSDSEPTFWLDDGFTMTQRPVHVHPVADASYHDIIL